MKALATLLVVSGLLAQPLAFSQSPRQRPKTAEYDYKSLALSSIRESVPEAKKLTDINHKVRFLIEASSLLADSNKNEAMEALDLALVEINDWESQAHPPQSRKYVASYRRDQIIAQYLKLNPEKANQLLAEDKSNSPEIDLKPSQKETSWRTNLNERRNASYKATTLATQLLESDPERAITLLAESVRGGILTSELWNILLQLRSRRSLLLSAQERIVTSLSNAVALDNLSIQTAAFLAWDEDMLPPVRANLIQFLLRSLEAAVHLANVTASEGGGDPGISDSVFVAFSTTARPVIQRHDPNSIGRVDVLLEQLAPRVSTRIRDMIKRNDIVEPADLKERLDEIKREADPDKRDFRLLRLIMHILQLDELDNEERILKEALREVTDEKLEMLLNDFAALDRVSRLTKAQKITDAVKATEQVTNANLRAWALLAISSVVVASDRFQAMTLVNAAMKSLDSAPPTPRRVEIALIAVAVTSKTDPNRAIEILSLVPKYANAVENKDDSSRNTLSAISYEVSIGELKIKPSQLPAELSDIAFDPSIRLLAKRDWFGLKAIANSVKDPVLSLSFKLELAKGVLKDPGKPSQTATSQRP